MLANGDAQVAKVRREGETAEAMVDEREKGDEGATDEEDNEAVERLARATRSSDMLAGSSGVTRLRRTHECGARAGSKCEGRVKTEASEKQASGRSRSNWHSCDLEEAGESREGKKVGPRAKRGKEELGLRLLIIQQAQALG